jgi:hypothetical protein
VTQVTKKTDQDGDEAHLEQIGAATQNATNWSMCHLPVGLPNHPEKIQ